jgi:hypothetical protein
MAKIQSKVLIYQSELNFLAQCILDYPETETGCDLFGFWTHTGHPVIQYIIGPGELAKRSKITFHQDETYLKSIGNELRTKHGLQHLGNFHSHHSFKLKKPSQQDSTTVVKAMNSYQLDRFLLMIGNIVNNDSTTINAYQYNRGKEHLYVHSGFVVLPSVSPIRTIFDASCSSYLYKPKSEFVRLVDLLETSLENHVYSLPDYPLNYWLRSKKSRECLNGIMHKLNLQFNSVRARQDDRTSLVYLSFGTAEGKIIKVTFPDEFPTTAPVVASFDFDWFKYLPIATSTWHSNGSLVLNTVNYIIELVTKTVEIKEECYE